MIFCRLLLLVNVSIAGVRLHTGHLENRYLNHGRPGCRSLFLLLQHGKLSPPIPPISSSLEFNIKPKIMTKI